MMGYLLTFYAFSTGGALVTELQTTTTGESQFKSP